MVNDIKCQSLKGGGVHARTHWIPIVTKGDIFPSRKLSIPWWHFGVPPNLDVQPTSTFLKTWQCNATTPTMDHKKNERVSNSQVVHFQFFLKGRI